MAKAPKAAAAVDEMEVEAMEVEVSPVARVRMNSVPQLSKDALRPSGTHLAHWDGIAQAEHTIEDVLHPRYCWSRASEINQLDLIRIVHVHGQFEVELRVIRVDHQARGIVAHIRNVYDYSQAKNMIAPTLSDAKIEHLGARKWAITDGHHVVKDEFVTRAAAESWLASRR